MQIGKSRTSEELCRVKKQERRFERPQKTYKWEEFCSQSTEGSYLKTKT